MTPLEPQPTQLYCEGIEGAVGWLSDGPKSNVCLSPFAERERKSTSLSFSSLIWFHHDSMLDSTLNRD